MLQTSCIGSYSKALNNNETLIFYCTEFLNREIILLGENGSIDLLYFMTPPDEEHQD